MFWQEESLLFNEYVDIETEVLQTDIQRFVAILGFCLMAVFALVQAIPVTSPEKDTVISDLSHKVDGQNAELEHLQSENKRLKKEIDQLMQYAGSLKKDLHQAGKLLDQQKEDIDKLAAEKIVRQEDLVGYKKLLLKRDEKIRRLKAKKEHVEQILERAVATVKDLVPKENGRRVESITPVEERGLYVAFESDRVFLDLLGSGKIRLFINVMGMKKGFQVVKKGGRLDFRAGGPGNGLDLWEVKESMVPFEILEAFNAWTTLSSREKMLIIGLTPEISRQIRDRKVSIGRFIIREGGSVTYSPDGE